MTPGNAPRRERLPGEALLVSVPEGAAGRSRTWSGELWCLRWSRERPAGAIPWGFEAEAALANARRIVHAVLPVLGARLEEPPGAWYATPVWAPHGSPLVDGESFGASMLAAVSSLLLGLPVPAAVAASAAVDVDGNLGAVGLIETKLAAVLRRAPWVRTFLVATGQPIAGRARRDAAAAGVEVREVDRAEVLLEQLFGPALRAALRRASASPDECAARARQLHDFALETRPVLSWRGVQRSADALLEAMSRHEQSALIRRARAQASFASRVAARHHGEVARLPWPSSRDLQRLPREHQFQLLAHVLQSKTDAGDARLEALLPRALEWAGDVADASRRELILLGAVGRAWARLREHRKAAGVLRAVVGQWLTFDPAGATIPLSELLRVTGLLRDRAGFEALARDILPRVLWAPRSSPQQAQLDQAFLRLASGRARVLLGQPDGALVDLADDRFWAQSRVQVRTSRLRWQARALERLNDFPGAAARRRELQALVREKGECADRLLLARLDELRAKGAPPKRVRTVVQQLTARYPGHCRLLVARRGADDAAEVLADEYPY